VSYKLSHWNPVSVFSVTELTGEVVEIPLRISVLCSDEREG
jgi:hypothetical protein